MMPPASVLRLVLLATLCVACTKAPERPAGGPPPVPVEVVTVERRDVPVEMRAIGAVEPIASVQLKAKVQGEITQVLFADGASVKAGQPLFTIDPRPFEAALRRAEADLTQAQSQAQNAADQASRYTQLKRQGVASREEFSQFVTASSAQNAVLAARQADVDTARLSLEWATVRAPISGRAGAALLKAGNIVQANSDVLTVINQTQPIYVAFAVPESQLAEVRRYAGAGPVTVAAASPNSSATASNGSLDFIDNVVDRESGMIAMKATFPNADESLWPGQFVEVTVTLTTEKGALVVPSTAILESQSGTQVFVVKDAVATLQPVTVGRTVGDLSVITSGLEAGQDVIATGQLRVSNGARVTVNRPPGPVASR